ncbi:MAG: biopolymer transporter ExbD [Elusimicrobiales bacterium]|nr:biopolymer transporter ExbD [Elusimicrobiales bacterium]
MKIHNTSKGYISEINMIPLIDVMLIILIIFMIITPFFSNPHIKVNLPKTSSRPDTISSNSKIITVTLKSNSQIYIDGRKTENLERELIIKLSKSSEKTVLVEADKNISIQNVINILDIAKNLGAQRIGIGVSISK